MYMLDTISKVRDKINMRLEEYDELLKCNPCPSVKECADFEQFHSSRACTQ